MKKLKTFGTIVLFLSLILVKCSKDENPVEPPVQNLDATYKHILDLQLNLNTTLTSLLAVMDTTAALDSLRKIFLKDTSVSAAYADFQGINVQYKNGMRGGIFINGDDEESDSLGKVKNNSDNNEILTKPQITLPNSKSAIFINPHYYERSGLLGRNNFFYSFESFLSNQEYTADTVLYFSATLDKFANLSSYGYIQIYSHGNPWPSQTNISEVYLLTGEKTSEVTTKKYLDDIKAGNILISFIRKTGSNMYFINPNFFTKYNNFQNSGSLIYGGFCHSFQGTWSTKLVDNAKAKVYLGFDWSVPTDFNIETSIQFLNILTNNYLSGPVMVGEYFNLHTEPVRVWYDNRWVTLMYNGASDFALWNELKIESLVPDRGTTGTSVQITGTGFGRNEQGYSTVKFNGVTAAVTDWSDGFIKTSVPNGATTGNVVVTVDGKESNGILFTIDGPDITSITPDSAYVSDLVYIQGSHFGYDQTAVKVYFGSIQATEITQVSYSSIGVKVPANSISGNVHVEVNGVSSNNYYFKVLSQAPMIYYFGPTSVLPGNYFRLYGSWKPANNTPPNTYLRINGTDYPIDYYVNWNSTGYLFLQTPQQVTSGMKDISLVYAGQESNKVNMYIGIPLDTITAFSNLLNLYSTVWVELLKPDQTVTRTPVVFSPNSMTVSWVQNSFSANFTEPNKYTLTVDGKVSPDGMSIIELNMHKKSLTDAGDVILTLKEGEEFYLEQTYYSTYSERYWNGIGFMAPDYKILKADILNKFNVSGKVVWANGEEYTIQKVVIDVEDPLYWVFLDFL